LSRFDDSIALLDMRTRELSPLPQTKGLVAPRWSPDGHYLSALQADSKHLVRYDFASHERQELTQFPVHNHAWSRDSQAIYVAGYFVDDPALFRVRIADGTLEKLVSLRVFGQIPGWGGLVPDDSIPIVRDLGIREIYALDWQVP